METILKTFWFTFQSTVACFLVLFPSKGLYRKQEQVQLRATEDNKKQLDTKNYLENKKQL